jgi:hypothetical protein
MCINKQTQTANKAMIHTQYTCELTTDNIDFSVIQGGIIQYLESLGNGHNKLMDTNKHEYNSKIYIWGQGN